jgi:hypothetical protein
MRTTASMLLFVEPRRPILAIVSGIVARVEAGPPSRILLLLTGV